jgi:arginyl-tRNA synthetase
MGKAFEVTDVVAAKHLVAAAVSAAMARVLPAELAGGDPLVRRSEHADFQSNVALAVARRLGRPPREVARQLANALDRRDIAASVSGPGFLNLTVPDAALWSRIGERVTAERLGVGVPLTGERIVVDYSAPNIAKEMHVGHLRSTVIGDALARILGFLGADVIRQNHLGDWGTQFGMLIQYVHEHPQQRPRDDISALDALYRASQARFEADPGFAGRARSRVVALQAGDPGTVAVWRELVAESERAFQAVYRRMGVLLTPADSAGESTYNGLLADVVDELVAAGIAVESDGALCVFFDGITGPDGAPVPLIVRKADGGFGYGATDLATIRHRIRDLKATRILYVVDSRQFMYRSARCSVPTVARSGLAPAAPCRWAAFSTPPWTGHAPSCWRRHLRSPPMNSNTSSRPPGSVPSSTRSCPLRVPKTTYSMSSAWCRLPATRASTCSTPTRGSSRSCARRPTRQ